MSTLHNDLECYITWTGFAQRGNSVCFKDRVSFFKINPLQVELTCFAQSSLSRRLVTYDVITTKRLFKYYTHLIRISRVHSLCNPQSIVHVTILRKSHFDTLHFDSSLVVYRGHGFLFDLKFDKHDNNCVTLKFVLSQRQGICYGQCLKWLNKT